MNWEQIVVLILLMLPLVVLADILGNERQVDRVGMFALGVVGLYQVAIGVVLYFGGFWS